MGMVQGALPALVGCSRLRHALTAFERCRMPSGAEWNKTTRLDGHLLFQFIEKVGAYMLSASVQQRPFAILDRSRGNRPSIATCPLWTRVSSLNRKISYTSQ